MINESLIDSAKKIIERNAYLTLGTVNEDTTPWVSPLYYAYDNRLHFYWVSPKNANHSKNIAKNEIASLVMFDSHAPKWTGVGLYFQVSVKELTNPEEIMIGLRLEFDRLRDPMPAVEDFLGSSEYRVYKAVPTRVWITADQNVDGKTVDSRAELDLQLLINAFANSR